MNLFRKAFAALILFCAMFSSCKKIDDQQLGSIVALPQENNSTDFSKIENQLELQAEMERSKGFSPGMGLAESTLLESSGDYAGAVIAAYKELLWAYSYSNIKENANEAAVTKESMQEGLLKVREIYSDKTDALDHEWQKAMRAAEAVTLFNTENYSAAVSILNELFAQDIQVDSFAKWMILVCKLEMQADKKDVELYSTIRARYMTFPAYWYYGARVFDNSISADFSERCINLNPNGPYSDDARLILARYAGLDEKESAAILSRKEIEDTITESINTANPELLSALLPLISLRDNPFTLFASGAMRAMSANDLFKTWFIKQEEIAKRGFGKESRLSDRLSYIVRG